MLSVKTKKILEVAMANRVAALELATAIDSGSNPQAGSVAVIPASTNFSVPVVAASGLIDTIAPANAVIATDVNAVLDLKADNVDLVTFVGEVEARMDTVEAKINAVITALKAAGLMA